MAMTNIMTVDVEDYFQVSAFSEAISRTDWDSYRCRVERNTYRILELFDELGATATFFTLGWVAERYPSLVRSIVDNGHEIASHGFSHFRIFEQSAAEFRADVRKTKQILEDTAGVEAKGYRAASFSLNETTMWAVDVLIEEGHQYSSSIYPIRHDLYGMPAAPRFAFRPREDNSFQEVPITTVRVLGRNLPCGGGGYFRLLPYLPYRWAIRRINGHHRQPCIFYFHPWEIDHEQPRVEGASRRSRFRHYTNLARMELKLRAVLADFSWSRLDLIRQSGILANHDAIDAGTA